MDNETESAIAAGIVTRIEATLLHLIGVKCGRHAARSEALMRWMLACYSFDYKVGTHPSLEPGSVMPPAVVGARDVELCTALDLCAEIVTAMCAVSEYKCLSHVSPMIIYRLSEELLARSTKRGTLNARHPGWRV